jgi:hypothetical protein
MTGASAIRNNDDILDIFLPDKDDYKKHGKHGWTQPDQVHDGHICRHFHEQRGTTLPEHNTCSSISWSLPVFFFSASGCAADPD